MGGLVGGMDMFNIGGLIDALTTFDFAKAMIDDEVAQMMKRVKRGVSFSDEDLAVNLIKEIGPGGSYIVAKHTISRMKTEAVMTKMADRNQRTIWEKKGATDIQTRAIQRVREIMASNTNSLLPAEIDEKLRTQFQDMVSGELVPID